MVTIRKDKAPHVTVCSFGATTADDTLQERGPPETGCCRILPNHVKLQPHPHASKEHLLMDTAFTAQFCMGRRPYSSDRSARMVQIMTHQSRLL